MLLTRSQIAMLQVQATATIEATDIVFTEVCHVVDSAIVALTSQRAIAAYKFVGKAIYHTVVLTMAAAYYSGVLTRYGWEWLVRWAAAYVAQCERPALATLALPATATPVALLAPAPDPEPRILVTPAPVVAAVPSAAIAVTREVAVSADKLRAACDRLQGWITDYAAFTANERKRPNFQVFMQNLEICAREVAPLYCKRSKAHDAHKASLISRANDLIKRTQATQVAATPKRHLQAVR